jgi:hypothetical protein
MDHNNISFFLENSTFATLMQHKSKQKANLISLNNKKAKKYVAFANLCAIMMLAITSGPLKKTSSHKEANSDRRIKDVSNNRLILREKYEGG